LPAAGHYPDRYLGQVKGLPVPQPALAAGRREQRIDKPFLLLSEFKQLPAGCP